MLNRCVSWGLAVILLTGCQTRGSLKSPQQWVNGLAGQDGVACFASLRQASEPEALESILQGLHHPNPRVRGQCARLLSQRQNVTVVDDLQPLLSDRDSGVRQQAGRAMVSLLDDRELLELLNSDKISEPARVALAQAMLRDPAELTEKPFLDWLLDVHHRPALRASLYRSLRESHAPCYGQTKREQPLLEGVLKARQRIHQQVHRDALNPRENLEVRAESLHLYALLAGPASFSELNALTTPAATYRLREAALLSLGATGHPQAVARLARVAADEQLPGSLRQSALMGLQQMSNQPAATLAVIPLLQSPEANLRRRAASALFHLGDKRAIPPLQAALAQELDDDARCVMNAALRHLQGREAAWSICTAP